MNPYLLVGLCIFCFMIFLFLIAQIKKDNSIVDIGWGIGFIIVAIATYYQCSGFRFEQNLITGLTICWAVRLSIYILLRNAGKPEDFRYAAWRKEWGKYVAIRAFFQVFMLQGVILFINSLLIIVVNSASNINTNFSFFWALGFLIWLIGFLFESVGDAQMMRFKLNPANQGKVMNQGLWKYTRHPNYFGEATMWWGLFLISIPSGIWYLSILSPLTITFLLLKVSGVTMLEKKYEGNDAYRIYKQMTNPFFPGLPKR